MRKTILCFVVCVLSTVVVCAQTPTTSLKNALQLKLDEWHKAGSFPGATLGVVLANGESFGLQLTDTIPQDGPRLKGVVQGYAGPNNPFGGTDPMLVNGKFVINPQFEWTGGGYVSTAHDLARWVQMIYEGKAFSPELLPQVVKGVPAPMLGRESKYGLGTIIRKTAVGTSYGHAGFFPGYMTDMMYFPEDKVAVAVQVNTSVGRSLGKPLSRVLVEMVETIRASEHP